MLTKEERKQWKAWALGLVSQRPGDIDNRGNSIFDVVLSYEALVVALELDLRDLAREATEADVITLRRCGLFLDEDCLTMFV